MNAQLRLLEAPMAGLYPIDMSEANQLLVRFNHALGPVHRPFRSEAFVWEVDGEPLGVAVSASIVHGPIRCAHGEYERVETVELARQAAAVPWANRVLIRMWRELCAPRYLCWAPKIGASYSLNARHDGRLYRFDGWEKVRDDCGSSGGGTWGRKRKNADVVFGPKTLWVWHYDEHVRSTA